MYIPDEPDPVPGQRHPAYGTKMVEHVKTKLPYYIAGVLVLAAVVIAFSY